MSSRFRSVTHATCTYIATRPKLSGWRCAVLILWHGVVERIKDGERKKLFAQRMHRHPLNRGPVMYWLEEK